MKIVSWNVAGWATTIEKIKLKHGSLDNWLKNHQIDILCLQEVKISTSELTLRRKEYGAINDIYDTFWSCPVITCSSAAVSSSSSKSQQQRGGLNGVATFVKKGMTIKANSHILNDSSLDNEGRCLMTDHNDFALFNIYVPNSGQNHKRYPYKMKFLHALQQAVSIQQSLGKKIIIAGDYNIAPRPNDICRWFRQVNIQYMLQGKISCQLGHWNSIKVSGSSVRIICADNSNDLDSESFSSVYVNQPTLQNQASSDKSLPSTTTLHSPLYSVLRNRYLTHNELQDLMDAINYLRLQWPLIEKSLMTPGSVTVEKEGGNSSNTSISKYNVMATRMSDMKRVKIGKSINQTPSSATPYSLLGEVVTCHDNIIENKVIHEVFRDTTAITTETPTPTTINTTTSSTTAVLKTQGTNSNEPKTKQRSTYYLIRQPGYIYFDDFRDVIKALVGKVTESSRNRSSTTSNTSNSSSFNRNTVNAVEPIAADITLDKSYVMNLAYDTDKNECFSLLEFIKNESMAYQNDNVGSDEVSQSQSHSLSQSQWMLLADFFGETSHVESSVKWFHDLKHTNDLVDSFADIYPHSIGRFTCWEQYTNRRYYNEGSRIDHILVDATWWHQSIQNHQQSSIPEQFNQQQQLQHCNKKAKLNTEYLLVSVAIADYTSEQKQQQRHQDNEEIAYTESLRACTANGLFQPAGYDGGGIPTAIPAAYQHQFLDNNIMPFSAAGIIYTPPEYSDHVAVFVKLNKHARTNIQSNISQSSSPQRLLVLQLKDEKTKFSQPHLRQSSITSHFKFKAVSTNNSESIGTSIVSTVSSNSSVGTWIGSVDNVTGKGVFSTNTDKLDSHTTTTSATDVTQNATGSTLKRNNTNTFDLTCEEDDNEITNDEVNNTIGIGTSNSKITNIMPVQQITSASNNSFNSISRNSTSKSFSSNTSSSSSKTKSTLQNSKVATNCKIVDEKSSIKSFFSVPK